mmetsp:Transcript_12627/g.27245  ORF Transcript_12627/g.27245 Transcript_12627/m.27245 type:complete len:162 (+) Transcript_12627:180-665(+)
MHSQFIVPRDSVYLVEQNQLLLAEARKKITEHGMRQDHVAVNEPTATSESKNANEQELPRFFTPRECCRLQGFPEDFVLPFNMGDGKQRHLISQFYRQIGNAVSPPCAAAAAEDVISSFLASTDHQKHGRSNPVFDLVMKASPNRVKTLIAISWKCKSQHM